MYMALKARCLHIKNIGKTWSLLAGAVWGLFWAADAFIEKYDPMGIKPSWDAGTTHLPSHWQTWLVGLLLLVMLSIIEGSYRHHTATSKKSASVLNDLTARVEKLTWPDDRPKLAIFMWGARQANFLPIHSLNDKSLLAEYGFYLVNDGGTALDITVEPFTVTENLRAIGKSLARLEYRNQGFVPVFIENEVPLSKWALDVALEQAWYQRNATLEGILKDEPLTIPVSVVYKDYSENWYRSRLELIFIAELLMPNKIDFGPVTQERVKK